LEKLKKQSKEKSTSSPAGGWSRAAPTAAASSPSLSPSPALSPSSPPPPSLDQTVEDLKHHLFTWLTLALKFDRMAMRKLCSIFHPFPSSLSLSLPPLLPFHTMPRFSRSLFAFGFRLRLDFSIFRVYLFSFLLRLTDINSSVLYEKITDQKVHYAEWPDFIRAEMDKCTIDM
jgi:hypothetical protein